MNLFAEVPMAFIENQSAPPSWILPQPLSEDEITEILEQSGISDSELTAVAREHYTTAWSAISLGPGRRIEEVSDSVLTNSVHSEERSYIASPDLLRLLEARERAFVSADKADDILFQELTADQSTGVQQVMVRIRNQRRDRMHRSPLKIAGSRLELRERVRSLNLDENIQTAVEPIIEEFEAQRAALVVARWKRLSQLDVIESKLRIDLGPRWKHILDAQARGRALEKLRDITSARISTEFPLRDHSSEYVQRIVKKLPQPSSSNFWVACNTVLHPKVHTEINELRELSSQVSLLSGISPEDLKGIQELMFITQERNSKLLLEIEKLSENMYQIEHRYPIDLESTEEPENLGEDTLLSLRSEALQLLDAEFAYLRALIEFRKRQIATASALRGALPTDEANEATTESGLQMIQTFTSKAMAKNRRDEWLIEQHFESARELMAPIPSADANSTANTEYP